MRRPGSILLAALPLAVMLGWGIAAAQLRPEDRATPDGIPEAAAPGVEQGTDPAWPRGTDRWRSEAWDPPAPDPNEAERRGLTSPEVRNSQMDGPNQQGTRAPEPEAAGEQPAGLYQALSAVRRAPPGLDGRPIQRPNALGSEPTTEMTPVGGPEHLFPDGYVE